MSAGPTDGDDPGIDSTGSSTVEGLRSQSETLAVLVAPAIRCERPDLAQLGRKMAGPVTREKSLP